MKSLVEYIAKALVDNPDQVYVSEVVGDADVLEDDVLEDGAEAKEADVLEEEKE